MKLKNIFAKRMTVAEDLRVPVSRHFFYSIFGVRGRYDQMSHNNNFVCDPISGTGFFMRSTESHSYRRFVNAIRDKQKQNLFTLLFRKEPNFDRESALVEEAFAKVKNDEERHILSSYQNVLGLAKEEELLQRIVRAIKDKMGGHPNKALVSVLSHYKSSIAGLERDVRSTQIDFRKTLTEEQQADWAKVIETFHLLVESRRVWSVYTEDGTPAYQQVFFDMGIFDYIQVPGDTPVMRDHNGMCYYVLPTGLVAARSTVDFDVLPWNEVDIQYKVVDISTLAVRPQFESHSHKHKKHSHKQTDALSTLYGTTRAQVVGELYFPQLDLRFFVNHTGPAEDFARAIGNWKMKHSKH